MMETAEPWEREDPAARAWAFRHLAASRSLLAEAKMGPVFLVIADELIHEALQMPFMESDHVVEKIAPAGTHPAFGHAVLPRTAEAAALGLDAEALDRGYNFRVEIRAAIEDQIARRGIIRKCLAQLLDDPCALGCLVTLKGRIRRRSCAMTKKQ